MGINNFCGQALFPILDDIINHLRWQNFKLHQEWLWNKFLIHHRIRHNSAQIRIFRNIFQAGHGKTAGERYLDCCTLGIVQHKNGISILRGNTFEYIVSILAIITFRPIQFNPSLAFIISDVPKVILYLKLWCDRILSISSIFSICPDGLDFLSIDYHPFTVNSPIIDSIRIYSHAYLRSIAVNTISPINSVFTIIQVNQLTRREQHRISSSIRQIRDTDYPILLLNSRQYGLDRSYVLVHHLALLLKSGHTLLKVIDIRFD